LAGGKYFFDAELCGILDREREKLREAGLFAEALSEKIVRTLVKSAEEICRGVVVYESNEYGAFDRKVDRILTSRATGYPIMLIMLGIIFWLTIVGANYISSALSKLLFGFQNVLSNAFVYLGAPDWLHGIVVLGAYRVLAWVVSVMLPPMAVFFPLFTILEDVGYLPRVAYDLDRPFKRCNACGKQALTMCMGFGCNAAGVVGCRIIDSPRERLLAVLTNGFVPCNGKFPMLISLISIFFIGAYAGRGATFISAALLVCLIVLCVVMSFFITWFLSKTFLRGVPSSFALELPPYRMPKFGSVIVRSVFDRTLFVLGRAVTVAAPAGVVIWIMANVTVGGGSILSHAADFLDPFARLMGLDGVILIAFILGFPANEIVIPIAVMAYMAEGTIIEANSLLELGALFTANGWTWITATCVIIFSLFHWPCSTTLMTVKKETGSVKWTLVAALLPTAVGILMCMLFANLARLFSSLLYI
jgi:ferrous iron transport protein B